ncbi:MAG: recombination protein RecR [Bacteroidetes bacterium]|nr:MAG: recombination protein RecR [Bacteroidota bacterium]
MNLPSKHLEKAVEQIATLPGIGKKTALKLAISLLKRNSEEVEAFVEAIYTMKHHSKFCKTCYNISDNEICEICSNSKRNKLQVCVVEDMKNVLSFEATGIYSGVYHVLGGLISPLDGIGPNDLTISSLVERVKNENVEEVILALSTTMEGDATNYYIYNRLKQYDVKISVLSRGVAIGDDLEYIDEVTLGKSLMNRLPFENAIAG